MTSPSDDVVTLQIPRRLKDRLDERADATGFTEAELLDHLLAGNVPFAGRSFIRVKSFDGKRLELVHAVPGRAQATHAFELLPPQPTVKPAPTTPAAPMQVGESVKISLEKA